jgi:UDP-glucose 4-epimerase
MDNNVLIIGGNGFIGSHIVDVLVANRFRVGVLGLHNERYRDAQPGVEYINYDYGNIAALRDVIQRFDTIIHLAHSTTPKVSFMDPLNEAIPNLTKFLNLLELIKDKGTRILYFSSGGTVYGNPQTSIINEDNSNWPISPYGVIKATMERYLFMYHYNFKVPYVILRPSNVYGIRANYEGEQGIIPIFIKRAFQNEKIQIWGDGEIIRDYIYVSDVADAVLKILQDSTINGVFNLGSGIGNSINEILESVIDVANSKSKNLVEYLPTRSFDVKTVILDVSKLKSVIVWQPKVSLYDGISQTANWIKERLERKAKT